MKRPKLRDMTDVKARIRPYRLDVVPSVCKIWMAKNCRLMNASARKYSAASSWQQSQRRSPMQTYRRQSR
jgi:hypothetical protein